MCIIVLGFGSFLITFSLLMLIVHITRPKIFKLKATVTKWISLDIEMEEPKRLSGEREQQQHHSDDEKP
jgi:hypothetical protein